MYTKQRLVVNRKEGKPKALSSRMWGKGGGSVYEVEKGGGKHGFLWTKKKKSTAVATMQEGGGVMSFKTNHFIKKEGPPVILKDGETPGRSIPHPKVLAARSMIL